MSNGTYTRTPSTATVGFKDPGPYEAIVINNLDTRYMGGLVVELLRYTSSGGTPERSGQLMQKAMQILVTGSDVYLQIT